MDLRLTFSVLTGKLVIKACRLVKHSGTNLPGNIAMRFDKRLPAKLAKNFYVIFVTGTNGKTTTTSMIAQILRENQVEFITNKSGANLIGGITTLLVDAVNLFGKSKKKLAVIEVDEATVDRITNYLTPDVILVTNFFRDQLDRYGELYTTLEKVASGIAKSAQSKLILNADDSLTASLGLGGDHDTTYYGVEEGVAHETEGCCGGADAAYCIRCKSKYDYTYRVLGHLGGFKCPTCGYERPEPSVKCVGTFAPTNFGTGIRFIDGGKPYEVTVPAPGFYNVYNALAAIAFGRVMNYPIENTIAALSKFQPSFGRMESIRVEDRNIRLILAKNPTGFNQIVNYLVTAGADLNIAFLLNDRVQDGTDISWIWDVDFERLSGDGVDVSHVYASGTRACDMAVRLKYAGVAADKITIVEDYDALISEGLGSLSPGGTLHIVPTYTAMMDIRSRLQNKFKIKDFWL